jgi:hypothetical protein
MGKTKHQGLVLRYDEPFEIMEKVGAIEAARTAKASLYFSRKLLATFS